MAYLTEYFEMHVFILLAGCGTAFVIFFFVEQWNVVDLLVMNCFELERKCH